MNNERGARTRFRLDLGYDGTAFRGWAIQPGQRTVQGVLTEALARIARAEAPPALTVAGRTDSGVHARNQVAHVDLSADELVDIRGRSQAEPAICLERRLRGVLPPDVQVHRVSEAPRAFDARFSALWRRYCYRIADSSSIRDPLRRLSTYWHGKPLNPRAMNSAGGRLLGERDFLSYCRPREGASTIRTLQELSVRRTPCGEIEIWVQADAFCHNMVRALVGGLIVVGEGREDDDWPLEVLRAAQRDNRVKVMPAHGLTLEQVEYPKEADLAAQAERTRVFRGAHRGVLPDSKDRPIEDFR